jgi:chromosome segregation ATPase
MNTDEKFTFKYSMLAKLSSEMHDLQDELRERDRIEEESGKAKAFLDEELAMCKADMQRVTEELQHEVGERKRIEEECGKVKASLDEELASCKADMQRITEELRHEVQTWKSTAEKLQQSINQINSITNSVQTTAGCDGDKA